MEAKLGIMVIGIDESHQHVNNAVDGRDNTTVLVSFCHLFQAFDVLVFLKCLISPRVNTLLQAKNQSRHSKPGPLLCYAIYKMEDETRIKEKYFAQKFITSYYQNNTVQTAPSLTDLKQSSFLLTHISVGCLGSAIQAGLSWSWLQAKGQSRSVPCVSHFSWLGNLSRKYSFHGNDRSARVQSPPPTKYICYIMSTINALARASHMAMPKINGEASISAQVRQERK